jgi:hypothetical protein
VTGHGWWWHLFHDPMRDNPWSMAGLVVCVVVLVLLVAGLNWLDRTLRDKWRTCANRDVRSRIPGLRPGDDTNGGDGQ